MYFVVSHESACVSERARLATIHPLDDICSQVVALRITQSIRAPVKRSSYDQLRSVLQAKLILRLHLLCNNLRNTTLSLGQPNSSQSNKPSFLT